MTPTEGALELAALGFRLFPLRRGTKDGYLTKSWKQAASSNPNYIRSWGDRGCNFGMWCREHLVLDVDTSDGKPGLESLTDIEQRTGHVLPVTRTHGSARGGLHLIYKLPKGVEVTNRDRPLGGNESGINVRGSGGYVVAPGSTFEGKPYTVINRGPIAEAPDWLVKLLTEDAARAVTEVPEGLELDTPAAISAAEDWLCSQPPTFKGSRGSTTYRAACQLRDFGVSQDAALMLIDAHLVSRFVPPYDAGEDTTAAEVEHAYRYAQNAMGAKAVDCLHVPFDEEDIPSTDTNLLFRPLTTWKHADAIEPRQWLAPGILLRRYITLLVSPPGVGKSSLVLAYAMAVALGNGDWIGLKVKERARVLLINMEDDEDETLRRFHALCSIHGLNPADFEGWLHTLNEEAGHDPFNAVKRTGKGRLQVGDLPALQQYMLANEIGLVAGDPLVEIHEGDENSNTDAAFLMKHLRAMLRETNAGMLLVHHTRKPPAASGDSFAGSMDAGRGASAYSGAARIAFTLFSMSPEEASRYGVPAEKRHRYIRLDNSKASYTERGKLQWYHHEAVDIANGEKVNALKLADLRPLEEAHQASIVRLLLPPIRDARGAGLLLSRAAEHLEADVAFNGRPRKDIERDILACVAAGAVCEGSKLVLVTAEGERGRTNNRLVEEPAE